MTRTRTAAALFAAALFATVAVGRPPPRGRPGPAAEVRPVAKAEVRVDPKPAPEVKAGKAADGAHLFPRASGNDLPYGHKGLTHIEREYHRNVIHPAMNEFFRSKSDYWRPADTSSGKANVHAVPGQSKATTVGTFTLRERVTGLDSFYRAFRREGGKDYVEAFRKEAELAHRLGKLK